MFPKIESDIDLIRKEFPIENKPRLSELFPSTDAVKLRSPISESGSGFCGFLNYSSIIINRPTVPPSRDSTFTITRKPNSSIELKPKEEDGSYKIQDGNGIEFFISGGTQDIALTTFGTYRFIHTLSTGESSQLEFTNRNPSFTIVQNDLDKTLRITPIYVDGTYIVRDPTGAIETRPGGTILFPISILGSFIILHTLSSGESQEQIHVNNNTTFDLRKEMSSNQIVATPQYLGGTWELTTVPVINIPTATNGQYQVWTFTSLSPAVYTVKHCSPNLLCSLQSIVVKDASFSIAKTSTYELTLTPIESGVYTVKNPKQTLSTEQGGIRRIALIYLGIYNITHTLPSGESTERQYINNDASFALSKNRTNENPFFEQLIGTPVYEGGSWSVTSDPFVPLPSASIQAGIYFLTWPQLTPVPPSTYTLTHCSPTSLCVTQIINVEESVKLETGNIGWGILPPNFPFQGSPRVTSNQSYQSLLIGNATLSVFVYKVPSSTPILRFMKNTSTSGSFTSALRNGTIISTGSIASQIGPVNIPLTNLSTGYNEILVTFTLNANTTLSSVTSTWRWNTSSTTLTARQALFSGNPTFGTGTEVNSITSLNDDTTFQLGSNIISVVLDFNGRFDVLENDGTTWTRLNGGTFTDLNTTQYVIPPNQRLVVQGQLRIVMRRAGNLAGRIRSFRFLA